MQKDRHTSFVLEHDVDHPELRHGEIQTGGRARKDGLHDPIQSSLFGRIPVSVYRVHQIIPSHPQIIAGAYPPPDADVRTYFMENIGTSLDEARGRCAAFIHELLLTVNKKLSQPRWTPSSDFVLDWRASLLGNRQTLYADALKTCEQRYNKWKKVRSHCLC